MGGDRASNIFPFVVLNFRFFYLQCRVERPVVQLSCQRNARSDTEVLTENNFSVYQLSKNKVVIRSKVIQLLDSLLMYYFPNLKVREESFFGKFFWGEFLKAAFSNLKHNGGRLAEL